MQFFDEQEIFDKYDEDGIARIEKGVIDVMPEIARFDGNHSVGYFAGILMEDHIDFYDMTEDMRYDTAAIALQRYIKENQSEKWERAQAIMAGHDAIVEERRKEFEKEGTTAIEKPEDLGLNDTHGPNDIHISKCTVSELSQWLGAYGEDRFSKMTDDVKAQVFESIRNFFVMENKLAYASYREISNKWAFIDTTTDEGKDRYNQFKSMNVTIYGDGNDVVSVMRNF